MTVVSVRVGAVRSTGTRVLSGVIVTSPICGGWARRVTGKYPMAAALGVFPAWGPDRGIGCGKRFLTPPVSPGFLGVGGRNPVIDLDGP